YGPATISAYGMFVNLIFRNPEEALKLDQIAPSYLPVIIASPTHFSTYIFSHCWLHFVLKLNDSEYELPASVPEYMKKLEVFSQNCEENFADMYYFLLGIEAETQNDE